jgi:cytidine deaminase
MSSIHAEINAVMKLPSLPRNKKLKKIDLLVIKVSKTGVLGSSKPCLNCLQKLNTIVITRGYHLVKIHFSTQGGEIKSKKFIELLYEDDPHISKFYKKSYNIERKCL